MKVTPGTIRAVMSELGKRNRGVKKKFSAEEIAKRTARLRQTPNHLKHIAAQSEKEGA